jgi:hypothetical protein
MKLDHYLKKNSIKGLDFALEIAVTNSYLSKLRRHTVWPSREVLLRVTEATNGKVKANDFAYDKPNT